MVDPAHFCAGRLVADHEGIGLRAVKQAERDAGEGGVEQGALSFHHVPMVGIVGGRYPFGGA